MHECGQIGRQDCHRHRFEHGHRQSHGQRILQNRYIWILYNIMLQITINNNNYEMIKIYHEYIIMNLWCVIKVVIIVIKGNLDTHTRLRTTHAPPNPPPVTTDRLHPATTSTADRNSNYSRVWCVILYHIIISTHPQAITGNFYKFVMQFFFTCRFAARWVRIIQ